MLLASKRDSWVGALWPRYSMIVRWKMRIPLLESQFKREMEQVERAEKGTFNWNDFLFPSVKPEAPLKKPRDLIEVVKERTSDSEADPRFDKAKEALSA